MVFSSSAFIIQSSLCPHSLQQTLNLFQLDMDLLRVTLLQQRLQMPSLLLNHITLKRKHWKASNRPTFSEEHMVNQRFSTGGTQQVCSKKGFRHQEKGQFKF